MANIREIVWTKKKVGGDEVSFALVAGRTYVRNSALLLPTLRKPKAVTIGGVEAFEVEQLVRLVRERVATSYEKATAREAISLKSCLEEAEAIASAAPKPKAQPKPTTLLLFALPPEDAAALARKEARREAARAARDETTRAHKQAAGGRR